MVPGLYSQLSLLYVSRVVSLHDKVEQLTDGVQSRGK
jgi:hypothetical protein